MARIIIEKKISIGNGISEVEKIEYELPNNISYNGNYMSYDSYHQGYYSIHKDFFLSAKDYIKYTLNCNKQNNKNNISEDKIL